MNMRRGQGLRPWCRGVCGLGLALAAFSAAAQVSPLNSQSLFFDQGYNAHRGDYLATNAGLFYTDEPQASSAGAGSTLAQLGLEGVVSQQGSHLDYHLDSDIALVRYLTGSFPTEPSGYLDGSIKLKILPGLLSWIARETYTQVVIDPFAPVTADNLENLNYITTGPRLTLRPTLRTTVTLDALYSYVYSSSPSILYVNIDNQRYGGDLRVDRAFSSAASLYVTGTYDKVDFKDEAVNTDFNLASGALGYRLVDDRTVVDLSAGYNRVQTEPPGGARAPPHLKAADVPAASSDSNTTSQSFEGPSWGVNISRLITPDQRVALKASQQLIDAADAFRLGFDQAVPTIAPPQVAIGDPFTNREFGVDWRFQRARTSLEAALLYVSQRYELEPTNDRNLKLASVLLTRQLTPVINWDIGVRYQHQDSTNGARTAKAEGVTTNLRWQLSQRVGLRFVYAYTSYNPGFVANQVGVTVSYAWIGSGSTSTPTQLQPLSSVSTQAPLL